MAFDRINYCDSKLYEKYAKSGCIALWYGVESGNKNILEKMGKTYSSLDVKRTLSKAKKFGIKTICAIIVGFPGENEKTLKESLDLMGEIEPDVKDIIPFFLQKGSPVAFNPAEYGVKLYVNWLEKALKPWSDKEPHEINYYEIKGIPNTEQWQIFKEKSNYKDWIAKRDISEAEIAYLMGEHLNESAFKFVDKINGLLINKKRKEFSNILNKAWKISIEKIEHCLQIQGQV